MHATQYQLLCRKSPAAAVNGQAFSATKCRTKAPSSVCRASKSDQNQGTASAMQQIATAAASASIALAALCTPLPAMADLVQTVPASQVTQMARALPKQQIDKGKVWVVFIGSAASLFIMTVLAENNSSWFPAIAKANAAMAAARNKAAQDDAAAPSMADIEAQAEPAPVSPLLLQQELPPLDEESAALEAEIERQSALVEEALLSTSRKVLATESPQAATELEGNGASSSSEVTALQSAAATAEASQQSAEAASSSEGSHTNGTRSNTAADLPPSAATAAPSSGYAVVSEPQAAPAPVAWQGQEHGGAALSTSEHQQQEQQQQQQQQGDQQPVSAAGLTGVLEASELMQQFKAQQQVRQ